MRHLAGDRESPKGVRQHGVAAREADRVGAERAEAPAHVAGVAVGHAYESARRAHVAAHRGVIGSGERKAARRARSSPRQRGALVVAVVRGGGAARRRHCASASSRAAASAARAPAAGAPSNAAATSRSSPTNAAARSVTAR